MNKKMNYFMDHSQIYDLEYNIPLQMVTNNSMKGQEVRMKLQEQRKIFRDSSRSLSIDEPNVLNFPNTGMDLQFWENISSLGEDVEEI